MTAVKVTYILSAGAALGSTVLGIPLPYVKRKVLVGFGFTKLDVFGILHIKSRVLNCLL